MIKLLLVLSGILLTYSTKASIDSLLPAQGKFENLSLVEPPVIFPGEELFSMIDGGAEIYFEYGFVQALDAAYTYKETSRFDIQIYEMTSEGAAFGIFSISVNKDDSIVDIGFSTRLNDYYLMGCSDKFFYIISVNKSNAENSLLLVSLGKHLAGNGVQTGNMPSLITKFRNEIPKGNNLKYFKGNIALSAIYFFYPSNIFELNEGICIESEDSKIFVLAYPSHINLTELIGRIKEKISGNQKYHTFSTVDNGFTCIDKKEQILRFTIYKNNILITIGKPDSLMIEKVLSID